MFKIDNCDLYKTKYIKISSAETNILDYLYDKINCSSKVNQRVSVNGGIINLDTQFKTYYDFAIYGKETSPTIITTPNDDNINNELIQLKSIRKFNGKENGCNLCDTIQLTGFVDENNTYEIDEQIFRVKYTNLYSHPLSHEQFLFYKNFIIMNNNGRYMNNHLMLTLANHEPGKIKGSQYEILNREVLEDVIVLHNLIGEKTTMGHNYSLIGSENHFHIHMFVHPKIGTDTFGFDRFLSNVLLKGITLYNALSYNERYVTKKLIHDDYNSPDENVSFKCEYYYTNSSNYFVSIFNSPIGYKGISISVAKIHFNDTSTMSKMDFISIVHKFLNKIESDGEYTFTLYFPSHNHYLSVVILPQVKLGNRVVRADRKVESFRNITGFIFLPKNDYLMNATSIDNLKNMYKRECDELKKRINNYVKIDLFTDEQIINLLEDKNPVLSIYANPNLRYILKKSTPYINLYIEKILNFNSTSLNPKIIIINSTHGSDKSFIKKNLSNYFYFYKESEYVHINIDDFLMSIPTFKSIVNKISDYLKKNVLNKKLNEFGIAVLNSDKLTINDIITTNSFNVLSLMDYNLIFEYITNLIFDGTGKSIKDIMQDLFDKYNPYEDKMLQNIIEICKLMKFNIVIEGKITYDSLQSKFGTAFNPVNCFYIGYNFNEKTRKFIFKNIIKSNIETGYVTNYLMANQSFDLMPTLIRDYKLHLDDNNIVLIEQGYEMRPVDILTSKQINTRTITAEIKFFENFSDNCNRKKFSLRNSQDLFTAVCNPVLKKKYGKQIKPEDIATDINTKYLFDDNTTALIILNTFEQIQQSIRQIINYHNSQPNISHKLIEEDIKIVLKGGLNIRLYIRKLTSFIENLIEKKKQSEEHNLNSKQIKQLIDFFKDFEKENSSNIFQKIIKKSDLDFTIIMNKSKFKEKEYNVVKHKITIFCLDYLARLKKVLNDTNFFGAESVLKYNLNNVQKEYSAKLSSIEYNNVLYDSVKNTLANTGRNIRYKNIFVYKPADLIFNDGIHSEQNKKIYILNPNTAKLTFEHSVDVMNELNRFSIFYGKNTTFNRVVYNEETKIFDRAKYTFDLLRIKNVYIFNNNSFPMGEIIDISIPSYDTLTQTMWDNIEKINYVNAHYNFDINIFNLEYLAHDIEAVLFERNNIFPWEDTKYFKRINRYIIIKIFDAIIKSQNLTDLNKILTSIDEIKKNINDLKKITNKQQVKNTNVFFKLFLLLNETKRRINLDDDDIIELLQFYEFDQTTVNIDTFKQEALNELTEFYNNFINSINIIPPYIEILHKLFTKNDYRKKNKFFKDIYTFEQFGGYKELYIRSKKLYLMLKGGVLDIRPNRTNYLLYNEKGNQLMEYNSVQKSYLDFFIGNILPNIEIDSERFTPDDISNIKALAAGSFGASVLINHTITGKKFVMKIIGNHKNFIPNTPPVGTDAEIKKELNRRNNLKMMFIKDVLKEIYIGFGLSQQKFKLPNFNQTYAYFRASNDINDPYFKSTNREYFNYVGGLTNKNPEILNGNLTIIFIDAGDGDLTKFISNMIGNATTVVATPATSSSKYSSTDTDLPEFSGGVYSDAIKHVTVAPLVGGVKISKKYYYNELFNVLHQLLQIKNLNILNPITNEIVYITHNDIKPQNVIFMQHYYPSIPLKYIYDIEYIDYGGFIFASTFFTKMRTHTPFMYDIIYFDPLTNGVIFNGMSLTSPIYDICSAILTLLIMIVGWNRHTINSILIPLKYSIINADDSLNDTINNIVDNILPPLLELTFGRDDLADDKKETKRFIQKFMPYLVLFTSLIVYLFNNERNIKIDNAENFKNIEFKHFKLIIVKLDENEELDATEYIYITEKNMDAINKILDSVNIMSISI
jgi:hypothetical protein